VQAGWIERIVGTEIEDDAEEFFVKLCGMPPKARRQFLRNKPISRRYPAKIDRFTPPPTLEDRLDLLLDGPE
jgi:hypothetical protein